MQNLGGQTKSIMVFSELAYWNPRWDQHGRRCAVFVNTSTNGAVGPETSSPSSLFMKD